MAAEIKASLVDLKAIQLEYAFERGVNFEHRTVTLCNEITSDSFRLIDAALNEMESEVKLPVTVRINSLGGSPYDALAIVGRLKSSKCKIVTEGYGAIMSAAIAILACGDKRRVSKYAWSMFHESSYEAEGRHSEMKSLVIQQEREEVVWSEVMAEHSRKKAQWWLNENKLGDRYISPEEMLKIGVVDEII
jgi:ATP-dependent protease ClpP protease subunit